MSSQGQGLRFHVRSRKMEAMIELEEARQRILAAVPNPQTERIPPAEGLQRVLLERILAPLDVPPFDNSAMDGYAVRAEDVVNAKAEHPAALRLRGRIAAGQTFSGELKARECVRLFTGSPLPPGADAVVMQEDTRTDANKPEEILVLDGVKPFENVRLRGSDVKRGEPVASPGETLTAARLGLLSAMGMTEISVGKKPVVGLLVTGSELVEAGQRLGPGQIYESNRAMLSALVSRAGCIPRTLPLVPDTLEETQKALAQALLNCDAVMTSGGASVGEMDFVKAAFKNLGGTVDFWQVAMRPGKPFFLGRSPGKLVFGLPGNPVSAFVTFLVLVFPALRHWQGAAEIGLPAHPGVLAEPLANPGNRRHFMRVMVDAEGKVRSTGLQASHALSSLAAANGLVDLPPQGRRNAGETVNVMRLD